MPTLADHHYECPSRRLGDIAAIRLGFTPLAEKRHVPSSDLAHVEGSAAYQRAARSFFRRTVLMVQPSNITEDGAIDWRRLGRINVPPNQSFKDHMLQPGNVILCLRGVLRVAALTEQTLTHDLDATAEPLPIVASSAWAVIRPYADALTTDYLAWQLKQPATARRLLAQRAGSALQFIPLSVVQDLELPVPPPRAQGALVRTANLIDQAERLEQQRFELLRKYLAGSIQTHDRDGRVARTKNTTKRRNPPI